MLQRFDVLALKGLGLIGQSYFHSALAHVGTGVMSPRTNKRSGSGNRMNPLPWPCTPEHHKFGPVAPTDVEALQLRAMASN
jgi:hypothetical protein